MCRVRLTLAQACRRSAAPTAPGEPAISGVGRGIFEAVQNLALDRRDQIGVRAQAQGAAPLKSCLLVAADAPVGIAEMVVDDRVLRPQLDRALELFHAFLK